MNAPGLTSDFRLSSASPLLGVRQADLEILAFIGEHFVIDDELLTLLRGRSPKTNWRWKKKLRDEGLLHVGVISGISCIWLTGKGLRFSGLDFRPVTPSPALLRHNLCVAKTRLAMEQRFIEQGRTGVWTSERHLARGQASEYTRYGKKKPHLPDAEVLLIDADGKQGTVAIEVEITSKTPERAKKIVGYLSHRYREDGSVWYFCTQKPYNLMQKVLKDVPWTEGVVEVLSYEREVLQRLRPNLTEIR